MFYRVLSVPKMPKVSRKFIRHTYAKYLSWLDNHEVHLMNGKVFGFGAGRPKRSPKGDVETPEGKEWTISLTPDTSSDFFRRRGSTMDICGRAWCLIMNDSPAPLQSVCRG